VHALKQQLTLVDEQQREVQALRQQLEEVGDQQQELRELRQQLADGASRLHQEQASHAQQLHQERASHAQQLHQEQASHAQQLQQERASHQQQLAECEAGLQQARQAAIPARSTAEVGVWVVCNLRDGGADVAVRCVPCLCRRRMRGGSELPSLWPWRHCRTPRALLWPSLRVHNTLLAWPSRYV
jgi:phage host-nuclease inhibitor protein Gam